MRAYKDTRIPLSQNPLQIPLKRCAQLAGKEQTGTTPLCKLSQRQLQQLPQFAYYEPMTIGHNVEARHLA